MISLPWPLLVMLGPHDPYSAWTPNKFSALLTPILLDRQSYSHNTTMSNFILHYKVDDTVLTTGPHQVLLYSMMSYTNAFRIRIDRKYIEHFINFTFNWCTQLHVRDALCHWKTAFQQIDMEWHWIIWGQYSPQQHHIFVQWVCNVMG